MIRVNLLRNRVQEGTVVGEAPTPGGGISGQLRQTLVKVAVMLVFTVGLMIYESQNIRSLNEEQNRLNAQLGQLQTENIKKTAEVAKVKDVEGEAKELEDKLKILKLLSKLRLREVKTLDFMQSSIPEKVWLKKVSFESDQVHVESGHFTFSGNAVNTDDLSEFVKRLEDSAYLMDVIVVKNQEIAAKGSNTIRDFLFTAEVENKN